MPSPGTTLISADYGQIELRLMAHFSQDQVLLSILKSEGDLFLKMASRFFSKPETEVTRQDVLILPVITWSRGSLLFAFL